MLSLNPRKRPSTQEIMESEWFQMQSREDVTTKITFPQVDSALNQSIPYDEKSIN